MQRYCESKQASLGTVHNEILADYPSKLRRASLFGAFKKLIDRFRLKVGRDEEVGDRNQQIVTVGESPGNGGISWLVHQPMMIQVMSWDPRKGRVTIEDGNPVSEQLIGTFAFECGAVLMVMGDHRAGYRKIEAYPTQVG